MRAKGLGAIVYVTEIDPVKAIEAVMDGFQVLPMAEAAKIGDLFVTLTGCKDVITKEHLAVMKDGVLLANAGHFDVEINKKDLSAMAVSIEARKPSVTGYRTEDGRWLNLLAEGRLVNLAGGMGHPAEIMDMSFALQAKCLEYLAKVGKTLDKKVYDVPREIDVEVATMKAKALNATLDVLTDEQKAYLLATE
jgi:adenosylhomocysteinase